MTSGLEQSRGQYSPRDWAEAKVDVDLEGKGAQVYTRTAQP